LNQDLTGIDLLQSKIMNTEKVWYVTGASQGLGLTIVKSLLRTGYRVAATTRNEEKLSDAVGIYDTDRFLPIGMQGYDAHRIDESIQQTLTHFGRIDVIVNNAGYGMAGTVEEITEEKVRDIFEVNTLATISVVKSVLPIMRRQRSGYIINIGSVAGFTGAPGWAIYSATKAAVAAFSEVLAMDVKEFGIKVTVVEPSGFRTGFLTRHSLAYTEKKIEGYQTVKETQDRYLAGDGKQPGDPEKAAALFIQLAESPAPPLHLFLGRDAFNRASEKLASMKAELEAWKSETISADF
jgi:short-subunit dehydrogenase